MITISYKKVKKYVLKNKNKKIKKRCDFLLIDICNYVGYNIRYKTIKKEILKMAQNLNIYNLPIAGEILELGWKMHISYGENGTHSNRYISVKQEVVEQINKIKQGYAKELEKSPILNALLDMYLLVGEAKTPEQQKDIYKEFQNFQSHMPFESNREAYIDAGCILVPGRPREKKTIELSLPAVFEETFVSHGGTNFGAFVENYFSQNTPISLEDIIELHKTRPQEFSRMKHVEENFTIMMENLNANAPN